MSKEKSDTNDRVGEDVRRAVEQVVVLDRDFEILAFRYLKNMIRLAHRFVSNGLQEGCVSSHSSLGLAILFFT